LHSGFEQNDGFGGLSTRCLRTSASPHDAQDRLSAAHSGAVPCPPLTPPVRLQSALPRDWIRAIDFRFSLVLTPGAVVGEIVSRAPQRHLRTAHRARPRAQRRHQEDVRATELNPTQRVEFFRDVLGPLARGIPFGVWFIRAFDGVDLDHPLEAAKGRRVFELLPLTDKGGGQESAP
jgi:hypothetical protein